MPLTADHRQELEEKLSEALKEVARFSYDKQVLDHLIVSPSWEAASKAAQQLVDVRANLEAAKAKEKVARELLQQD